MALVAAKCTQCGQNLEVDSTQEAAICPYCKTEFITEKAITNYNTTYNIGKIDHADIHINDEKSVENRLKSAEDFLTMHKNAKKALQKFAEVADDVPGDYRGWWGMARANSLEFTYIGCGSELFHTLENQVEYALRVAPPEVLGKLKAVWEKYVQDVEEYKTKKQKERIDYAAYQERTEKRIQEIEQQYQAATRRLDELKRLIPEAQSEVRKGSMVVGIGLRGILIIPIFAAIGVLGFFGASLTEFAVFFIVFIGIVVWGISVIIKITGRSKKKKNIKDMENEQVKLEAVCQNLISEKARLTEASAHAQNEIQVIDKVLS